MIGWRRGGTKIKEKKLKVRKHNLNFYGKISAYGASRWIEQKIAI